MASSLLFHPSSLLLVGVSTIVNIIPSIFVCHLLLSSKNTPYQCGNEKAGPTYTYKHMIKLNLLTWELLMVPTTRQWQAELAMPSIQVGIVRPDLTEPLLPIVPGFKPGFGFQQLVPPEAGPPHMKSRPCHWDGLATWWMDCGNLPQHTLN